MRITKAEKELLQQAFTAPAPKKKRAFLRSLPRQEAGIGALVLSQAAYIKKWVWAVSFLVFATVVVLARHTEFDVVWMLSAIMPFAALLVMVELIKSPAYGMAELEMSSRFSLRTILLARMVMLGATQLFGVLLAGVFLGEKGSVVFLQNGVYLLVPYLLTALLGISVMRRLHGREGIYACGGVSLCISALAPLSRHWIPLMYDEAKVSFWVLAAVVLLAGFIKEYRNTVNQLEELV